jgi:hypothetical protein
MAMAVSRRSSYDDLIVYMYARLGARACMTGGLTDAKVSLGDGRLGLAEEQPHGEVVFAIVGARNRTLRLTRPIVSEVRLAADRASFHIMLIPFALDFEECLEEGPSDVAQAA